MDKREMVLCRVKENIGIIYYSDCSMSFVICVFARFFPFLALPGAVTRRYVMSAKRRPQ